MSIPESFIQQLLDRTDIVDTINAYVPLKKAGANYSACCPFHQEKTPSFTVSPTKQFYYCFGCGASGSAIGFLMAHQGLGFVEAIQELARKSGLQVPQTASPKTTISDEVSTQSHNLLRTAADFYRTQLKKSPTAVAYLKERGLTGKLAAKFQLGYAPSGWQNLDQVFPDYHASTLQQAGLTIQNEQGRVYDRFRERVMFPIHNPGGKIIGFGGRVLPAGQDPGPKYLNSPETELFQKGRELYGLFFAQRPIRQAKKVVVVEGYMDVLALAQHGIDYAVATLGTATTPTHLTRLVRLTENIIFCFDGDEAGHKAAWRAAMNSLPALRDELMLSFIFLPDQHDPDSYIRSHGRAAFEHLLDHPQPLSDYLVTTLQHQHDLKSQESRTRFLKAVQPVLQSIAAPVLNLMLRKQCAVLAGISQEELEKLLKLNTKPSRPASPYPKTTRHPPALLLQLLQMIILEPSWAPRISATWITQNDESGQLLKKALTLLAQTPQITSAALLESLNRHTQIQAHHISPKIMMSYNPAELEQEFDDAIIKLKQLYETHQLSITLSLAQQKSLQSLTPEQKDQLRHYRRTVSTQDKS